MSHESQPHEPRTPGAAPAKGTPPDLIGRSLGPHFHVEALVGSGGMGHVYRARDTRLDRDVAIKILPPGLASDAEFRERFDREAKTISSLSHPNICALHDIGRDDGIDYLVLEYLAGETLAARLAKGPLRLADALRIGIDVAAALDAAHHHGVVHRDLKPGNVMLTKVRGVRGGREVREVRGGREVREVRGVAGSVGCDAGRPALTRPTAHGR